MSLIKKIDEYLKKRTLRKMGEDYRHAHEVLTPENLEGYEEIMQASLNEMKEVMKKYPDTFNTLLFLGMGQDLRIKSVCKELGYNELETELFCIISKKISRCEPISKPDSKLSPKVKKIQEKITNPLMKKYFGRKLGPDEKEHMDEILEMITNFYTDKGYHQEMMNKFYTEIIPRLDKKMEK